MTRRMGASECVPHLERDLGGKRIADIFYGAGKTVSQRRVRRTLSVRPSDNAFRRTASRRRRRGRREWAKCTTFADIGGGGREEGKAGTCICVLIPPRFDPVNPEAITVKQNLGLETQLICEQI